MKKLLSVPLLAGLLAAMLTVGASATADTTVMTVDGKAYTDFQTGWNDALAATANNPDTVEVLLLADWTAENGSFGEGKGFRKGAIYISENTKDMTLDLNGHTIDRGLFAWSDLYTLPSGDGSRGSGEVLQIDEGSARITVKNGTIRGAHNKDYGGIYIDKAEDVLFEDMVFTSNRSDQGGALYNNEGKVTFRGCTFQLNYADYGGAVYSDYDRVTFENCTFKQNRAKYSGGALYNYDATFIITNSTFTENIVQREDEYGKYGDGGALYVNGGSTELTDCAFNNNKVYHYGGAIHHAAGGLKVTNCKFDGNIANGGEHSEGGACYVKNDATFKDCSFTNNISAYSGAVYADDTMSFTGCTFTGNQSLDTGGHHASALMVAGGAEVTMTDCSITNNTGDCAIHLFADFFDEGEIWFDGKMTVKDNFTAAGKQLNVVCTPGDPFTSSIVLKKNFSKASRVGVGMYDEDNRGEECVEAIPDSWTIADLAACFTLDECFLVGEYDPNDDPFYLEKDGDELEFHKGNPQNSIHAKAAAQTKAASIFGQGNTLFLVSGAAVVLLAAGIVLTRKKR